MVQSGGKLSGFRQQRPLPETCLEYAKVVQGLGLDVQDGRFRMWNSATAWLPTAFLISFIFPNPVLAEVETSLPALSESDTSESPDASATRAPDPGEMQRQFESQEEFEAAVRAHIEAERAAAWEKAHPPGRRTAAQMMGAPPGSIRVAPSPPNAQEFRERFEDKFDISELRVGIDESASGAPGKFEITGDLVRAQG